MTPLLSAQLSFLLPELFIAGSAILLLMAGAYGSRDSAPRINVAALFALVIAIFVMTMPRPAGLPAGNIFADDAFGLLSKLMIVGSSVFTLVLSARWLDEPENNHFEYPVLVLFSVVGMMLMVSSNNMLILYLGLELASLSQYVLAAFNRDRLRSTESGIKYFVLGSLASGMLLFGISLVYGFSGNIDFDRIAVAIRAIVEAQAAGSLPALPFGLSLGLILMLVGLCFKISAAPFHMWTPDVYEGAPTPVTLFFAVAPKVAATALIVRLLVIPFGDLASVWQQIVVAMSLLSMIVGAFGALRQTNLKRLLAYSSIGHIGFTLMGVATGTLAGISAVLVYLGIYVATSVGAFGCLLMMRRDGVRVEQVSDLAGCSARHPRFAFCLAVFMFSMAGIPPLAGFFAKMYVFLAAVQGGLVWLAVAGVVLSVVSAFYYLRIVKVMYFEAEAAPLEIEKSLPLRAATVAAAAFALLYLLAPASLSSPSAIAAESLLASRPVPGIASVARPDTARP